MFANLIRAIVAVTTTCLIIWAGNARAEILITTAAISRGELTIVGRVGDRASRACILKSAQTKQCKSRAVRLEGFVGLDLSFRLLA
jgi:hypothetical protein